MGRSIDIKLFPYFAQWEFSHLVFRPYLLSFKANNISIRILIISALKIISIYTIYRRYEILCKSIIYNIFLLGKKRKSPAWQLSHRALNSSVRSYLMTKTSNNEDHKVWRPLWFHTRLLYRTLFSLLCAVISSPNWKVFVSLVFFSLKQAPKSGFCLLLRVRFIRLACGVGGRNKRR